MPTKGPIARRNPIWAVSNPNSTKKKMKKGPENVSKTKNILNVSAPISQGIRRMRSTPDMCVVIP